MKNFESFNIELSSDADELIRTALSIIGRVNLTTENPVMRIKIKGTLILDFSGNNINQILELYQDE